MNNLAPRMHPSSPGGVVNNSYSSASVKPKVGLAVVCRCTAGNSFVQCLLQKRGLHSSSPNKWSFPGGRLEKPGDLDNDGAVGTERELNEECGGGAPPGLPPLIHIECCKTGKQSQTLYHVYVVDTSHGKEWETWQPKSMNGRPTTELDTEVPSLILQGQTFPCYYGYCWVDMSALIQECYYLNAQELGNCTLQHGLVRWVQNYGEHILKILIARSPKLPHPRRLSNPLTMPPAQNGHIFTGNPRLRPMRQDSGGKSRRLPNSTRGGMLQPPYPHGQLIQPNYQLGGNPGNMFFNRGMVANQSQLSPPSGGNITGSSAGNILPNSTQGYPNPAAPGGIIMHVPPAIASQTSPQAGLVYVPSLSMVQPSMDSPNHPTTSLPSSPVIPPAQAPPHGGPGVMKTEGTGGGGAGEISLLITPQTQSHMTTLNPLMATSALPVNISASQHQLLPGQGGQLAPGPGGGGGSGGGVGGDPSNEIEQAQALIQQHPNLPTSTVFPTDPTPFPPISVNQFLSPLPAPPSHPPLSTNTPLPPHPLQHPSTANTPGHTSQGESEPLLPNPPLPPSLPLLPLIHPMQPMHPQPTSSAGNGAGFPHHQQQQQQGQQPGSPLSSRKEILCRHYMQGNCPFGEKCWFAHPDPPPLFLSQVPRAEGAGQGVGMSSPMHAPNFWLNNPLVDYAVASPPQSPLNPALMPRPSIVPAMFRPRGAYPNQQPLVFLRGPLAGTPRIPGSNLPLIPPTHIPLQVNPALKFSLLSEVVIHNHDNTEVVTDVSQLATYADHFFVSYEDCISTYKIIFGGNRTAQESAVPTEKKKLEQKVSCLHSSIQQPMLLLVGMEDGGVSLLDMRKGVNHGNITPAHAQSVQSSTISEPISALIHFTTSTVNSAQVVVTGTRTGIVTWYISQPPQKTYSLLFLDREIHTPHKILALQMLGGFLVSGDSSGKVAIWSMMSQTPTLHASFQSHTLSLTNLHTVDPNHFITIGTESNSSSEDDPSHDLGSKSQIQPAAPAEACTIPTSTMDDLSLEVSQLSVQPSEDTPLPALPTGALMEPSIQYSVKLWEFGKPPKVVKVISADGTVVSTSFHCHTPPGNMFLGLGLKNRIVKIYNIPNFTISSELHFPEMKGGECVHIKLNHSREVPLLTHAYYRNPFRDLILTSVWSDGVVMVCQVAKQQ